LGRVRETALGAYTHQELPFERLVEELQPARTLQHDPIVQVTFAVQNLPDATPQLPGVVATYRMVRPPVAKFDLACFVYHTPSSFRAELEYVTDLFDARTAHRMLRHYRALLAAIVADPDRSITALSFVESGERKRILRRWNRTGSPAPAGRCVHRVFEDRAAAVPDVVAVESGPDSLTYAELNARANRLARYLTRLGVGPETRVAVHLDRSADLIVALLGILKAGGAYLPLALNDPPERLRVLLEDSATSHVVTQARCAGDLPACAAAVLCLEDHADGIAAESDENLPARTAPANLACVLYTSGSTGLPKGVGLSHGGAVRLVRDQQYLHFGPDEVFLHLAPTAFDASTFEIWGALLNGSRLALAPSGVVTPEEIGQLLARHRVTTLFLTAGLFRLMVDQRLADLSELRQLISGGDVLPAPQVARVLEALPQCRLFNAYGPTETTTIATVHPIAAADTIAAVPIGRPIGGTRVYVLDRNLEPSPIGVSGELFIGGVGVARGYLGHPGQTAERFVPDPFQDRQGTRMYRTGDRARWRSDGVLEFLGRADNQVKLRGFRIEPGEIEALLGSHPGVRHSAVVVRRESDGDKRLAAFVVPIDSAAPEPEELRSFLKKMVPDYMVPAVIELIDQLPLTDNGKVDRRVLAQRPTLPRQAPRRRPETPTEEILSTIWTELLGRKDIGPDDDFFALGGHSLLAVQVLSRVNRSFSVELPMSVIFEAATLAQLAERIDRSPRIMPVSPRPPLVAVPRRAPT
jgi:amino acid adenylation domain-containing protein